MTAELAGYKQDAHGRLVPEALVDPLDLLRDELVRKLAAKAQAASDQLRAFRELALSEIDALAETAQQQYGARPRGAKGNLVLYSFDGKYRITLAAADFLRFDERLTAAKSLVDECLLDWSVGNENLRALVTDAFQVDKQGRINVSRVLSLRRVRIDDPRWRGAMQAIADATTVCHSKQYLRVHERDKDGVYRAIALDIQSM